MKTIIKYLATLGLGLLPKAPGTWGTLAGIPVFWLTSEYSQQDKIIVLIALFLLGWLVCIAYTEQVARHDAPEVVIDEVVGYYITSMWFSFNLYTVLLTFIFFRLFDIFKPWPISWIDRRMYSGLGMMLDDAVAGLFAAGAVWIALELTNSLMA